MESAKIKNYILVVLLLLNAFLAALLLMQLTDRRASVRAMEENTLAILAQHEITVTGPFSLQVAPAAVLPVQRDLSLEQTVVSRLLSGAVARGQDSSAVMYTGKSGQAVFRGTGEFELLMTDDSVQLSARPAALGARLMHRLGMESTVSRATVSDDGDSATVVMTPTYQKCPILNCEVTFTFTGHRLLLAVGRKPPNITGTGSPAPVDSCTALMRALALMAREQLSCTELRALQLCYVLDCDASGSGTLTPVWRIETDVSTILISAVTGEPVNL